MNYNKTKKLLADFLCYKHKKLFHEISQKVFEISRGKSLFKVNYLMRIKQLRLSEVGCAPIT